MSHEALEAMLAVASSQGLHFYTWVPNVYTPSLLFASEVSISQSPLALQHLLSGLALLQRVACLDARLVLSPWLNLCKNFLTPVWRDVLLLGSLQFYIVMRPEKISPLAIALQEQTGRAALLRDQPPCRSQTGKRCLGCLGAWPQLL